MSQANEAELLMLGLINEERASRGLDPVTINADLNQSSEDHSQWMLDTDTFSHTGVGGSSSRERIEDAGYDLEGNWRTAENIGWQSERGEEGIADDVADIHESLMNSPGHRANLLNPDLEEIGIGVEVGDFNGFDAVMITQNFGTTEAVSDMPESEGPVQAPVDLPDPDVPVAETVPEPEDAPVPDAPVIADDLPNGPADDIVLDQGMPDFAITTGRVVNTVTSTSVARNGEAPVSVTTESRETSDTIGGAADAFEFFDFDCAALDKMPVEETAFEGVIATPAGTQTFEDRDAFETMMADILEDFGLTLGGWTFDFA